MNFVLKPWQLVLIVIAGWMNREQQEVPGGLDLEFWNLAGLHDNSFSGPLRFDALPANERLEFAQQLLVRSNRMRRLFLFQGETHQTPDGLADSPLDRV